MNILLTGIKVNDIPHIGHYYGIIQPLIQHYLEYNYILVCIADLHSLISNDEIKEIKENTYLLCKYILYILKNHNINYENIFIYRQSKVEHLFYFNWYISTIVSTGLLNRGHAVKNLINSKSTPSVGLYTYPLLMASDIIMSTADAVLVGEDQKQHIEYTNQIIRKLNKKNKTNIAQVEPLMTNLYKSYNGEKMSKSYKNTLNLIIKNKDEVFTYINKLPTDGESIDSEIKNIDDVPLISSLKPFLNEKSIEKIHEYKHNWKAIKEYISDQLYKDIIIDKSKLNIKFKDDEIDVLLRENEISVNRFFNLINLHQNLKGLYLL